MMKKQLLEDFIEAALITGAIAPAVIGAVFDAHWPFWIGYIAYLFILMYVFKPEKKPKKEPKDREFVTFDLKEAWRDVDG